MTGNICCNCFSIIFVYNQLPDYIKAVNTPSTCEICGGYGNFYARKDELEDVREQLKGK